MSLHFERKWQFGIGGSSGTNLEYTTEDVMSPFTNVVNEILVAKLVKFQHWAASFPMILFLQCIMKVKINPFIAG